MRINGKRASYYKNAEILSMLFFRKTRKGEDLTDRQMHELRKVLKHREDV